MVRLGGRWGRECGVVGCFGACARSVVDSKLVSCRVVRAECFCVFRVCACVCTDIARSLARVRARVLILVRVCVRASRVRGLVFCI